MLSSFGLVTSSLGRELKCTCLLWEGKIEKPHYYMSGEQFSELSVPKTCRSVEYELKNEEVFALYVKREKPIKDEQGNEVIYTQVGSSKLPNGTDQLLFVLFQNQEKKDRYRIYPIDDSLKGFPPGHFRFINLSGNTLGVHFGESLNKLNARAVLLLDSKIGKKGGLVPFRLFSSDKKKLFETRLFAQPTGRELVFIEQPKKVGQQAKVKFIPQLIKRETLRKFQEQTKTVNK